MNRRSSFVFAISIAGLALACGSAPDQAADKALDSAVKEAEAAGIKFGKEAMAEQWRVDPSEDAMPDLKVVFERQRKIILFDQNGKFLDQVKVADDLFADKELLDHLRKAVQKPRVSFALDALTSFPELASFKQTVKLLTAAAIGEARRGNWSRSHEYLTVATHVSRLLGAHPGVISALVQIAVDAITTAACTTILSESDGSAESVKLVRGIVGKLPGAYDLRNAWPFEVQHSHLLLMHPELMVTSDSLLGNDSGHEPLRKQTVDETRQAKLVAAQLIREGVVNTKAVQTLGFPEQYDALLKASSEFEAKHGKSLGYDTDLIRQFKYRMEQKFAVQSMTKIAAWAFESRRLTGHWPTIYPDGQVLNDVRGFKIRYVVKPEGVVIYTLGPNGKDEGGVSFLSRWSKSRTPDSDDFGIGFPSKPAGGKG